MNKEVLGQQLREIRRNIGLTQHDVSEQTGISHETLRRLENGKEFVRFSTLEKLSELYKVDLYKLASMSAELASRFNTFLEEIGKSINHGSSEVFHSKIKALIDELSLSNDPNEKYYISYLGALLKFETYSLSEFAHSELALSHLYIDSVSQKANYYITPFEITLNIYWAIFLRLKENIPLSISVLQSTLTRVKNLPYPISEKTHSIVVIHINLSNAYHNLKDYNKAISLIDDVLFSKDMAYRLDDYFQLLFRKGISQFKSGSESYKKTFSLAFSLIDSMEFNDLHTFYKAHLLKVHNIDIDVLNN
jgi:transcriptional regulator with XRE-family HTH domain